MRTPKAAITSRNKALALVKLGAIRSTGLLGGVIAQLTVETAQERGLAGADRAGEIQGADPFASEVGDLGERLLDGLGEVEKAGIGREAEGGFG